MIYNYIVVGAGISGLYFSHLLKTIEPLSKVLILESSNRIGGRILKEKTGAQMGAKFVHDDFKRFFGKSIPKGYKLGSLTGKSTNIQNSMLLEENGSISKSVDLKYDNEKNIPYDFSQLLDDFNDKLMIKYKTPFLSYTKENNYYLVNGKYKTEKIVFATPPNILKTLDNPYKSLFKHYIQANIITLAFNLKEKYDRIEPGFSFYEEFPKTSFYFDPDSNILYVNLFDKYKNFLTGNVERKIVDKFSLKNYKLNKKEWSKGYHLQGAWTVPKSSLSLKIVKILETGYDNSIFYVGDYLGDIQNMGKVTTCMRSVEKLIKNILK